MSIYLPMCQIFSNFAVDFMPTELLIDNRPCMVYAMPEPRCLVLTTLGAHERKDFETLAQMIARQTSVPFILAAFTISDWEAELAPWADSALSQRPEVGTQAGATLDFVANALLPELQGLYGSLPVILGGYSLAGLFALWAAYQQPLFAAVAAASPSVWIRGWMPFVQSRTLLTPKVYLSLGIKEEKTRNRALAQVGDNIRAFHDLLTHSLGEEHTTLVWHNGGHFTDCTLRLAQAIAWCINRITTL